METVLTVVGTRPEAIKMAPVILALRQHPEARVVVCATGQHREIADEALALFGIEPEIRLNAMSPDQSLAALTARLLEGLDATIDAVRPDWVLAQGDTTTVLAAGLAALYRRVRFGHVEAGLRTIDRHRPFPEEMNRRLVDRLADAYFAPTTRARDALIAEGCPPETVHQTGNTIVDALQIAAAQPYDDHDGRLAGLPTDRSLVLVTLHRRELFGEPMTAIANTIANLALTRQEQFCFVVTVHPNPAVRGPLRERLADAPGVFLLDPLDYRSLIELVRRSCLVVTDSGGLQEEVPSFGIPLLIARDETERPEGIEAGLARLIGTEPARFRREIESALETERSPVARIPNPYGDGRAAERIVKIILGESLVHMS